MNRMRWIGVGLWAACLACAAIAVGFGFAAANDQIERALGVALAVGFGVTAEVLFWAGGATFGLSFFAKRGAWFTRLFARKAASVEGGR